MRRDAAAGMDAHVRPAAAHAGLDTKETRSADARLPGPAGPHETQRAGPGRACPSARRQLLPALGMS